MARPWERVLASLGPLLVVVYVPALAGVGLAMLGVLPAAGVAGVPRGLAFWALLALAIVELPVSFVIGGRLLTAGRAGAATAAEAEREERLLAAARVIRTGTLATALLGAAIAVYAVALHLLTGERERLVYFLLLIVGHLLLTRTVARRARAALEGLAERI